MAIISKSQEGGPAGLWTRVIRVDSDGNFSSNLPEVVAQTLGYSSVEGKTKREVEDKVDEAIRIHEASTNEKRKVILFSVSTKYCVRGNEEAGEPFYLDRSSGNFFENDQCGVSLALSVGVFEETVRVTSAGRRYEYRVMKSSLDPTLCPRDLLQRLPRDQQATNLLPWTQDLEDFFLRTAKAMTVLAQALKGLSTPEKVLAIVAQSACALPYSAPEAVPCQG